MSEILDKLATCERITEWVDPWDERLVVATGEPSPNSGCNVRKGWFEKPEDWRKLSVEVKRLLVPEVIASKVVTGVLGDILGENEFWQTVTLDVPSLELWSLCFPVNDRTEIMTRRNNRIWVGLGLCATNLGIAVFSRLTPEETIDARIQLMDEEVFKKLIEA